MRWQWRDETLTRGDSWRRTWIVLDASGNPLALGDTARLQVRNEGDHAQLLVDASTANGKLTIDAPNGRIDLFVPASEMNDVPVGVYRYDLEVSQGAERRTIDRARLTIQPDVTR